MRPEENKEMRTEDSRDPSAFPVEGEPRESVSESGTPRKRKRPQTEREIRKERRNKGCEYTTESGKKMPKKSVAVRCKSSRCRDREFYCHELTEQDRIEINVGFFRSGQFSDQRNFLASYVDSVTERQIRTALKKRQRDGQIAMEGRGGRREAEKVEDEEKRQSILDHNNKFPRMESHYCRANTENEFLAPELNLTTMYNMYVSEIAADIKNLHQDLYTTSSNPWDSNFLL
ncbi:hypothetical protein PoB_005999000 [Plakobranchus ocellatus]|uniref:Uncharacterized protein n=1 Tax=Plakobranchus ocellatus TaxID=259542 RepID=A0AAV4CNR4_9GAST|nr:hypothetical protein PoB_005999000 [Plakobranchus ocellatus]